MTVHFHRCMFVVAALTAFAVTATANAVPLSGQDTVPLEQFAAFDENSTETISHKSWARVLGILFEENQKTGRLVLNYSRISRQARTILKGYLTKLQAVEISKYSRKEQLAYWLNFYNASSFGLVIEEAERLAMKMSGPGTNPSRQPTLRLKSLMQKDDGPWREARFNVEGTALSLTDIEHRIVMAHWADPRVLYGIACSAKGCPNLTPRPFTAEQLTPHLAAAGQNFIKRKDTVSVKGGQLKPSSIYVWHTNLLPDTASILAHLRRIGPPELEAELAGVTAIKGESFSWKLNGTMDPNSTANPVGLMNRGSGQSFY
jgi:hypothetical protein